MEMKTPDEIGTQLETDTNAGFKGPHDFLVICRPLVQNQTDCREIFSRELGVSNLSLGRRSNAEKFLDYFRRLRDPYAVCI